MTNDANGIVVHSPAPAVTFSQRDREMITEIHEALTKLAVLLDQFGPMVANLSNTPMGKMLGL